MSPFFLNPYVAAGIVLIIVFAFVLRHRQNRSEEDRPDSDESAREDEDGMPDLNEEFLAAAAGEDTAGLVRTFHPTDLMILRSILASEGIPNFVPHSHVGGLLPGVRVQGYTDSTIVIRVSDAEDAIRLTQDYIETIQTPNTPKMRNALEFLAAGVPVAAAEDRVLPELLLEWDSDTGRESD